MNNDNPSVIFEGMPSVSAVIKAQGYSGYDRKILKIFFDGAKAEKKRRELDWLSARSREFGFEIELCGEEKINSLVSGKTHGGVAAVCTDRTLPRLEDSELDPAGVYFLLEGIEDPFNFGHTVRTLYAAGVTGMVLPPRNWLSAAGTAAKSSGGTSELLPVFEAPAETACAHFKERGFSVVCAGIRDSVSIFEAQLRAPLLVVIGGEKRGISRQILDMADKIVRIDYGRPFSGSLPTSVASAVFAFEIMKNNLKKE